MKGVLACLVVTVVIFSAGVPGYAQAPVKIGALLSMTGMLAYHGPLFKEGIVLAIEMAGGEVAGRKIELIVEDDASNASVIMDKARKLVEKDKVHFIIGPQFSGGVLAVAPYLDEMKVPNLAVGANPEVVLKYKYHFETTGTMWTSCYPMGKYAYDTMGFRTITVLSEDMAAGYAFAKGFMAGFKELGGVVVQEQYSSPGTVDYGPYLTKMKKADALMLWLIADDAIAFMKQYREYGLLGKLPIVTPKPSPIDERILPAIGDTCLGIRGPGVWASVMGMGEYFAKANKVFVDGFRKKYGRDAEEFAATGYTDVQVILAAIKATGGDLAPENIRKAILGLKLETPEGPLSFTPEGWPIKDILIVEADKKEGKYFLKAIGVFKNVQAAPKGYRP